jgi:NTP pyrophosphatase (non-canonical NTP hydrolase)
LVLPSTALDFFIALAIVPSLPVTQSVAKKGLARRLEQEQRTTMTDGTTFVSDLRKLLARFVQEREWEQFHSPKNLSMALAVEVSELMEHFLWIDGEASRSVCNDPAVKEQVADELADVACLLLTLCNNLGLDLSTAIERKVAKNVLKYPVEKCRGRYRVEE